MQIIPPKRPQLTSSELEALITPYAIDRGKFPLLAVGIRGYYQDSMGVPDTNDRGIYDDAIFITAPGVMAAFNGNTDPSVYRAGIGTGSSKGMASLNAGIWFAHRFGQHKKAYLALCQLAGPVTVTRDGNPPYADTGMFGINIHKGSYTTTSSEGCQTIHPDQWDEFIDLAQQLAKQYYGENWLSCTIPYILINQ